MRLIDADALKADFEANVPVFAQEMIPGIFYIIDRAKTVDAEPQIIRCKDCTYGEQDNIGWYCRSLGCQVGNKDGTGFCADAERRENGGSIQ